MITANPPYVPAAFSHAKYGDSRGSRSLRASSPEPLRIWWTAACSP